MLKMSYLERGASVNRFPTVTIDLGTGSSVHTVELLATFLLRLKFQQGQKPVTSPAIIAVTKSKSSLKNENQDNR